MSITIIAPPVPSSKWKSAFSTLAPDIPVFEGYKLNKPEQKNMLPFGVFLRGY